jgi:hypothetical protein
MSDQLNPEPENPYEFEKELKSNVRAKASGIITTALIIAGGLLGGAAFAVNAQSDAKSVAPGVDQAVVDTSSQNVSQTEAPSPEPVASEATQPVPVVAGNAPVASNSTHSSKPSVASTTAPAPVSSTSATPAPSSSSTPKTIAVPPAISFGGGDDNNGDHHDGKRKRDKTASSTGTTGTPSFGNGDDENGDD